VSISAKEATLQVQVEVLSQSELEQVHDCSLRILMHTGLRVESSRARKILGDAGAQIDENKHLVRIPPVLVDEALRAAPRYFTLGGRRPGWYWPMNYGDCTLLANGEARSVVEAETRAAGRALKQIG
jgi:trimethylamine--corrinoid protein Co-methyltransferase